MVLKEAPQPRLHPWALLWACDKLDCCPWAQPLSRARPLLCAQKTHLCCAEHFPDAPGLRQHGILLTTLLLSGSPCRLLFFRRFGRWNGRLLRLRLGAALQLLLLRKLLWHRGRAALSSLGMHAVSSGAACSWPALLLHHGSSHIIPGWHSPTIACGCGILWRCRAKLLQAQPQGRTIRLAAASCHNQCRNFPSHGT